MRLAKWMLKIAVKAFWETTATMAAFMAVIAIYYVITNFIGQADPPRVETVPAASLTEAQRAQFEPFGISEQLPRG